MLRRALAAEGLGSMLLAATVIGSGIMGERLAGGNLAVALLANTAATVAVLATLIALFGPVSGAHFNPAVSIVEAFRGKCVLDRRLVEDIANRLRPGGEGLIEKDWHVVRAIKALAALDHGDMRLRFRAEHLSRLAGG